MWDNGRSLKMLNTLHYDSVALQQIIDVDKYIASSNEGYDLCQNYMLYCSFCNKWVKNPCASAYFVGNHFLAVCRILNQCGVAEPIVIQAITDVDKYLVSETVDFDVCGKYAPFCVVCDKSIANPCATAYFRYKAMGLDAELPKVEQDVAKSTTGSAVAVTAYEPELSVTAESYLRNETPELTNIPAHEDTIIPSRLKGIKIARAKRRLPM